MKLDWEDCAPGADDKVSYGILETSDGDAYLRITQIPNDALSNRASEHNWTTVSVENWDFGRKMWYVDNALIQSITESRNLFTVVEDQEEFGARLTRAQAEFDAANPPTNATGGDKPAGTEGQS